MRKFDFLLISLVIVSGIFLRFHLLTDLFTEYDDVDFISIYKVPRETIQSYNIISGKDWSIKLDLGADVLRNLLDSPFYALSIAHTYSSAPGQYFLYPFLISEKDTYWHKLTIGRAVSAAFSSATLILLYYLFLIISNGKPSQYMPLALLLVSFSFNSVLYAHHMSVFSVSAFTIVVALICYTKVINGGLKFTGFAAVLGALSIFNYLMLLTVPIFSFLYFFNNLSHRKTILKQIGVGALIYALIFSPVALLFFKASGGMRGTGAPSIKSGVFAYLAYFPQKFFWSISSIVASFSLNEKVNVVFSIIIIFAGLVTLYKTRSDKIKFSLLSFSFLLLLEWLVLHGMHKLVLEQTRHLVFLLPLFALMFFLFLSEYKISIWLCRSLCVAGLILGLKSNLEILELRRNAFDYEFLEKAPETQILTYSYTVGPLAYFQDIKPTYCIEDLSFYTAPNKLNLPDRILLVSQEMSFADYRASTEFEKNRNFFKDYKFETLVEKPGEYNFTFNNATHKLTQPNGFFVYRLTKLPVSN